MSIKSKIFRVVSLSAVLLSVAIFAFGDTIRLKDGSIIKGKIVSFDNGQFVIVVGEGSRQRKLNFFADEISSIQFDNDSSPTGVVKTSATKTEPAPKKPTYTKTTDGTDTIITVGSAPKNGNTTDSTPTGNTDTTTDNTTTPPANTTTTTTTPEPIQIRAKVLADNTANGWTNSGWVVRKGQKIRILGSGRISLGNGRYSSPRGISTLPDPQKLIKDKPTGGLIAVIGDDNNDFIFIGAEKEFIAERDGALFLGINEGVLTDNTGSFDVTVEIDLSSNR